MKTIIVSLLTFLAWINFGESNPISSPQCTPGSVFKVDCNWCYCAPNRVAVCTLIECPQALTTEQSHPLDTALVLETVSHQDWDYDNTASVDEYSSSEFDLHNFNEPEINIRKRQATSSSSSESSEEEGNTKVRGYTKDSADSASNESTESKEIESTTTTTDYFLNMLSNLDKLQQTYFSSNSTETPDVTLGAIFGKVDYMEGENIHFECHMWPNNPQLYSLSWLHNGKKIEDDKSGRMIMLNRILSLLNVTQQSSGDYNCIAASKDNQIRSNIVTITVKGTSSGSIKPL